MRVFLQILAVLVVVAVLAGLGTMVYNAGVSAGVSEAAQLAAASGDPVPVPLGYWGYGYDGPYAHGPFGFGFFGLIFAIFVLFLLFGLLRAAFGWGRWGGRGPGDHHGPGGWGGRREAIEEWHRDMHRRSDEGQQPAV